MTMPMPASLWAATAPPAPSATPLAGAARTAVAVVGGGFTGLSAALHLAEAGVPVTLLEAAAIGWGASGRNNGQVIPTLSRIDPDEIVAAVAPEHGGRDKGEQLVGLIRDSASFTFDLIRRHGIEAEAVQNGWIQPAHRASRLRLSEARADQWGRRGAPVRLYSRAEMAALTGTDHWHGGWGNPTGGRINPLGLARGMAAAAIGAGAVIHTDSAVRAIRPGPGGWLLDTARGTLTADRVVVATQAYTDDVWPGLKRTIVPVRSYQMATSVLSDNIRRTILPEGHALSDTRGDLYFYRFDANGRLVTGGGLIVPFGWDGRIRARIAERVRRVFPQIGELRFDYTWWGYIAATADRMPHVYELAPGVLGWTGCNGRGVALGVALGHELARASNGTPLRDIAAPVETRLRSIAGHAFRSLGIAWNVAKARRLDARD
ncbi:FAD-binding oxidoreductase [Roseomonas sp. CAU 1739]|uniref:NAD(P)/FAD-dependent oxidoreductase n=1 Tax=Roseomonas sp. CAU 1739 TaxID=3140364 RepID=UPI00325B032F